jgi:archaemetzincin
MLKWLFALAVVACHASWIAAAEDRTDDMALPPTFRGLVSLSTPLGPAEEGDWLASHPEKRQTYREYLRCRPVRVEPSHRNICVAQLGALSASQQRIVSITKEYLGIYFQLPVTSREELSLDLIPKTARRTPSPDDPEQLLTTFVLQEVLRPRIPPRTAVFIAFTGSDLWPGEGWNYLFGQASLSDRVGVWSIHRFGNPDESEDAFQRCLRRTLKTATHETGHMFSLAHCTLFECNMCGCNHLAESDRMPLYLCPHCLAKLCYATKAIPTKRFKELIVFFRNHGFPDDAAFCEKSLQAIRKSDP